MYTIQVRWLDEQRSRASFNLPGRTEWRAEHLDQLIAVLSEIRATMSPAVPEEPPAPHMLEPLHDPRYATQLHPFSGGTLFEFRHPALGWFEFVLPSSERHRVTRLLVEQEEQWQRYR